MGDLAHSHNRLYHDNTDSQLVGHCSGEGVPPGRRILGYPDVLRFARYSNPTSSQEQWTHAFCGGDAIGDVRTR